MQCLISGRLLSPSYLNNLLTTFALDCHYCATALHLSIKALCYQESLWQISRRKRAVQVINLSGLWSQCSWGFQLTLAYNWSGMNSTHAIMLCHNRTITHSVKKSAGRLECTSPCGGACETWLAVTDTKCSAWGKVYNFYPHQFSYILQGIGTYRSVMQISQNQNMWSWDSVNEAGLY